MRDFEEATRAARERLDAEAMTAAETARLERVLRGDAPRRPQRRTWLIASMAMAVAVVVAVVVLPRKNHQTPGGFLVLAGGDACVSPVAEGVEVPDACATKARLAMDGAEAELVAGTTLVREQDELRLRKGQATFTVSKRKQGERAFAVRVSDGAIVVTGTRFTVTQASESGSVAVTEGTVELRWADGEVTKVRAGEKVAWPRPSAKAAPAPEALDDVAPVDVPHSQQGRRASKSEPPPDANKVLRQLLQLRTQHRTDEALALLREARNTKAYNAVQRERFGFELCSLMTQERGTTEACACWTRHARDFPASERQLPDGLKKCAK